MYSLFISPSLININAYHQPGVEAGKKAAGTVIELQKSVMELLHKEQRNMTVNVIAELLGKPEQSEMIFAILRHLSANPERGIVQGDEDLMAQTTFRMGT